MKLRPFLFTSLAFGGLLTWGCQAGNTTGSGGGSTSQGGAGGSKADTTSTTAAGFGGNPTMVGSGGAPPDCVAKTAETTLEPLDIIVVLDESGSMTGTKWTGVTAGLKSFITDPASAGISVGIVYFPNELPSDCNYLDYATLDVGIGMLPGNAAALVASINAESPQGGTPTWGALKGALSRAVVYQDMHPDHKVIVVFASDGDPSSCAITDIPTIAGVVHQAYNYNGVQTYAIAMAGATVSNLDQIAAAGGTMQSIDVTTNIQTFSQKMKDIQSQALSCEFVIPPPPDGKQLDPTLVNVNYTAGGQGMPTKIPQATGSADCGVGAGWYYDNATMPTKILLCPASCQQVKADTMAKVDVAFGCKTVPN